MEHQPVRQRQHDRDHPVTAWPDERTLLHEIWQISHFGRSSEATIRLPSQFDHFGRPGAR